MPTPYAYFQKQIVPLAEAKIGIMTHAFNYGTGVFEGIRGNCNEETEHGLRLPHEGALRRASASRCKIMRIEFPYTDEELFSTTTSKLVEMGGYPARTCTSGPWPTRAASCWACGCTTWRTTS